MIFDLDMRNDRGVFGLWTSLGCPSVLIDHNLSNINIFFIFYFLTGP